jgi:hypothetical protein
MEDISLDSLVPTQSNYLTKDEVGEEGKNLTIAGFKMEEVGQGPDSDTRCIMGFVEDVKPMVVNKTNMNRLKHITGAQTTGQARGKTINVYNDPMVEFGGKMTGGIRIRQATTQPAPNVMDPNDSIPFMRRMDLV